MKITHDRHDRLILSHVPWRMAGLVAAMGLACGWTAVFWDPADGTWQRWVVAALALCLLWFAWWGFPATRTVFDRSADVVVIETRRLTGTRITAHPLDTLDRAQVRSHRGEAGGRITQLVLVIDDTDVPLERGFGPVDRRTYETAINDWLTTPPPDAGHA